jgi:ubiquinone/menaquinone biosynthesis C-methylase UbiE
MSSTDTFDRYARDYDATVQAAIGASGETVRYFAELKARLVAAEVAVGSGRVLDFGCGVGNLSRALVETFPAARVVGVDSSEESLQAAHARAPSAQFVQSFGHLPFPTAEFDVVVAACVFHHIDQPERMHWLREISRVLVPGGFVILFEHNPLNPLTQRVVRRVPFDAGVSLIAAGNARRMLSESGFKVRRRRYYFFFPRALSVLRRFERAISWLPLGAQYLVVGQR